MAVTTYTWQKTVGDFAGRRVNINRSLSLVVFVSVIDPSTAIDAILALALGGSVLVGGIAKS